MSTSISHVNLIKLPTTTKHTTTNQTRYLVTTSYIGLYRLFFNRVDTYGNTIVNKSRTQFKVLHLMNVISETSMPYNEFTLAMSEQQDITVCTYFPSDIKTPLQVMVVEGDGTLFGFLKLSGAR